jgi:hypothetical protein
MTHDEINAALAEAMPDVGKQMAEGLVADFGEDLPFGLVIQVGSRIHFTSNAADKAALAEALRKMIAQLEA